MIINAAFRLISLGQGDVSLYLAACDRGNSKQIYAGLNLSPGKRKFYFRI